MVSATLENQNLRIIINPHGAEMQSFYDVKRNLEYLWQADPTYWARHAPILFPIVGRLKNDTLHHLNQHYPMTQHGFARDSEFEVIEKTALNVKLRLTCNENTLKQYPFKFELIVEYALHENTLLTTFRLYNPTNTLLPAAIGAHPAFNWPLHPNVEKSEHLIRFKKDEDAKIRRLESGLLLDELIANPIDKKQLVLSDSLFEHDALVFDQLNSRELTYIANDEVALTLRFEDFPHLGVWTKLGAPFICIEPWQGYSSPVDFDGEFSQKPGILNIPAHSMITKSFEIMVV